MAVTPVPSMTDTPSFPALSDRAAGTYNAKAYAFGAHMANTFNAEFVAVAVSARQNATEAASKASAASEAAAVAVAAVAATQNAAADAASALSSKQAAAQSATTAAQSATAAQQAKQSVDQSLAAVAGGPVISINGLTGVVNIKVPTTGDVVVSARGDYSAPAYLPLDGGTYLRSSYPTLAAMIPLQYPNTKMNQASIAGSAVTVEISSDNTYMAVGGSFSGFLRIYKRIGNNWSYQSGALSANPAGQVNDISFSPDGIYLAVSHQSGSFLTIYKRSGDIFTKLTDPATLPLLGAAGVSFSASGSHLSVAQNYTPGFLVYARSGDAFTKVTDSTSVPTNFAYATAFSPNGTYLALAPGSSDLFIYKRNGNTFTKLETVELPPNDARSLAFSSDSNYLAVGGSSLLVAYKRAGDVFTRLSIPALPFGVGIVLGSAFSADGNFFAVATSTGPLLIYRRTGDTFSRLVSPSDYVGGSPGDVAFSADSTTMAIASPAAPYLTSYRISYDTSTMFQLPVQGFDGSGLPGYIKT